MGAPPEFKGAATRMGAKLPGSQCVFVCVCACMLCCVCYDVPCLSVPVPVPCRSGRSVLACATVR